MFNCCHLFRLSTRHPIFNSSAQLHTFNRCQLFWHRQLVSQATHIQFLSTFQTIANLSSYHQLVSPASHIQLPSTFQTIANSSTHRQLVSPALSRQPSVTHSIAVNFSHYSQLVIPSSARQSSVSSSAQRHTFNRCHFFQTIVNSSAQRQTYNCSALFTHSIVINFSDRRIRHPIVNSVQHKLVSPASHIQSLSTFFRPSSTRQPSDNTYNCCELFRLSSIRHPIVNSSASHIQSLSTFQTVELVTQSSTRQSSVNSSAKRHTFNHCQLFKPSNSSSHRQLVSPASHIQLLSTFQTTCIVNSTYPSSTRQPNVTHSIAVNCSDHRQ